MRGLSPCAARPYRTGGARMDSESRTIDPRELAAILEKGEAMALIDVRRKADYDADPQRIPHAVWKDPNLVGQWSDELPKDRKVIVYCVRGGSVSNTVLDHLIARKVKASYIRGGISAWKEQGGPLVKKTDGGRES